MSPRNRFHIGASIVAAVLAVGFAVSPAVVCGAPPDDAASVSSRLATYQTASDTYFALSVSPERFAESGPRDVVVLFDTSASQTGPYRDDSLATLDSLLAGLAENVRVKVATVDLTAELLTPNFVSPIGPEAAKAMESISARAPLGSTDIGAALQFAAGAFGNSSHPRSVIYIGDGLSKASLLAQPEFESLVKRLVDGRISVNSFAIGPQRDMHLLSVLANHTGGVMLADRQGVSSQQAGQSLARTTAAAVYWPVSTSLTGIDSSFPKSFPPLRSDRDTVLIGSLADRGDVQVNLTIERAGHRGRLSFEPQAEPSNGDFAFLPQMVETARHDGGLALPTAGSEFLREAGRVMLSSAHELSKMGQQALSAGNLQNAELMADAAARRDPENPQAQALKSAVKKARQSGNDASMQMVFFQDDDLLLGDIEDTPFVPEPGNFLNQALQEQTVQEGIIRTEVQNALIEARQLMATDPLTAKENLKQVLEGVRQVPELDPEVELQLRTQIEAAIREASRREVEVTERRIAQEQARAAAIAQQRILDATRRNEQRVEQLMARFNSLMDEGRYIEAEVEVAPQIGVLVPDSEVAVSAPLNAELIGNFERHMAVRELRMRNTMATLFQVEESSVPFPDEPPIVYPDPAVWEDLTRRRKKFASIDLARRGTAETRIFEALQDPTNLQFIETPLSDVVDFWKDLHQIPIEIDRRALDDVGIGTDTPITRSLQGITLRSALRLVLKELELTYMIRDEVLLITTPEEAESQLVTKVYPVADLVLPIVTMGQNTGQLGGGMGGGMGGGGMGGGGMGGGMGGGGFGGGGFGGGGGGFFAVEDEDLRLGGKTNTVEAKPAPAPIKKQDAPQPAKEENASQPVERSGRRVQATPIRLIDKGLTEDEKAEAWARHFAENDYSGDAISRARVRQTVRELMRNHKFTETAAVIRAALRSGQPQPWMYEALVLALQAGGASEEEIERAVMSAVDFSSDPEFILYAAKFLAKLGFDRRALDLLQEVAKAQPTRVEPFVEGLKSAQRLNDIDAIRWACAGVLGQAWPQKLDHIKEDATRIARATLKKLSDEGRQKEFEEFEAALGQSRIRDCVVEVNWTGDADVDVYVKEPAGSICSLHNPRTTSGGVLLGDTFAHPKKATSEGYTETYVCPQGFSGEYRVFLRRVWGDVTAGKVSVKIYTNYGSKMEKVVAERAIPLAEKDALLVFELPKGRRTEPLDEKLVENAVREQVQMDRAVVAHHLNKVEDSQASQKLVGSRRRQAAGGAFGPRKRGGAGFRPVITTLPEGASFSATAVISADRRYVRITPTPFFSQIGEVNTFTFTQ